MAQWELVFSCCVRNYSRLTSSTQHLFIPHYSINIYPLCILIITILTPHCIWVGPAEFSICFSHFPCWPSAFSCENLRNNLLLSVFHWQNSVTHCHRTQSPISSCWWGCALISCSLSRSCALALPTGPLTDRGNLSATIMSSHFKSPLCLNLSGWLLTPLLVWEIFIFSKVSCI